MNAGRRIAACDASIAVRAIRVPCVIVLVPYEPEPPMPRIPLLLLALALPLRTLVRQVRHQRRRA